MRFLLHVGRLRIEAGQPEPAKPPTTSSPVPQSSAYPLGFHVTAKPVRRNGRGYVTEPRIGGRHA